MDLAVADTSGSESVTSEPSSGIAGAVSSKDLLASLNAELAADRERAQKEEGDAGPFVFPDESEESADAEASTEEPKTEEPKVEEKLPPKESDVSTLNKLTQAQAKLQRIEAAELAAKQRADLAETKASELEAALKARDESDIFAEFARRGTNLRDWLQELSEGKIEIPDIKPKAELPPELQRLVDKEKAAEKAAAEKAAFEQEQKAYQDDIDVLKEHLLSDDCADFPILRALPDGAEGVYQHLKAELAKHSGLTKSQIHQKTVEVLPQVIASVEAKVKERIHGLLSSDAVIALIASTPELSAKLAGATKVAEPAKSTPDKPIDGGTRVVATPTTLTRTVSPQVQTRAETKLSDSEFLAQLNREISGQ